MLNSLKAYTTIYTRDIRKAIDFYGHILGAAETFRFPKDGTPNHVEFLLGGTTLVVCTNSNMKNPNTPTTRHPFELGIQTNDVDTAVQTLRAANVSVIKEPANTSTGNRYAYIEDPDGNWISLYANPAAH